LSSGSVDIDIEQEISRADFESWIADDIGRIGQTVDRLLDTERVRGDEIDSVFLTGGSSFIRSPPRSRSRPTIRSNGISQMVSVLVLRDNTCNHVCEE